MLQAESQFPAEWYSQKDYVAVIFQKEEGKENLAVTSYCFYICYILHFHPTLYL